MQPNSASGTNQAMSPVLSPPEVLCSAFQPMRFLPALGTTGVAPPLPVLPQFSPLCIQRLYEAHDDVRSEIITGARPRSQWMGLAEARPIAPRHDLLPP